MSGHGDNDGVLFSPQSQWPLRSFLHVYLSQLASSSLVPSYSLHDTPSQSQLSAVGRSAKLRFVRLFKIHNAHETYTKACEAVVILLPWYQLKKPNQFCLRQTYTSSEILHSHIQNRCLYFSNGRPILVSLQSWMPSCPALPGGKKLHLYTTWACFRNAPRLMLSEEQCSSPMYNSKLN